MVMSVDVRNAVAVLVVGVIVMKVLKFLHRAVWEPLRLRRIMEKQGLKGPPYRFLFGQVYETVAFQDSFPEAMPLDNYANLSPTVTPQCALFFPKYGRNFVYAKGIDTRMCVRDVELAKEIFINNHASLRRNEVDDKIITSVVGRGILVHMGQKWATERRQLNPFFHQDALKSMVAAMVEGTTTEIQKWEQVVAQAGGSAEIDIEDDLLKMNGRMFSHTAFGIDFNKGEQIRELMTDISKEVFINIRNPLYWIIPGYRKIPTKRNRYIDQSLAKVHALVQDVMDSRREAVRKGETTSYGNDLLGRMLGAATEGWDEHATEFNLASVFSNTKLIYFGGQTSVAVLSLFLMLMLAIHPEWQERARKEVAEVIGDAEINASALLRLKVAGMIINETLRCFPPAPSLVRKANKDIHLKSLFIPKGLAIEFGMVAIHQDKTYWGDDVGEFKPERFANGVAGACTHPQAFSPFGLGPKFCIGSNFAMIHLKVLMVAMLQKFELLPSPNYKHHPTFTLVQRPKFGMHIILKAL
ncbi:hypothetical protein KC19_2G100300 [Ceratodon purpureus]|uniref:Cytochrome P450 n=1 Tax=Ceratodon purpureus TaxID=3225 RepID=A0A8T0IW25_CERPU|nr:hypothetical protein KC19_2G100300 [Ceratodon purpureus]